MLEKGFQVTEEGEIILADSIPKKNAIVSNSIRNVTNCKDIYKTMYGAIADCLREAFNYLDKEQIKK